MSRNTVAMLRQVPSRFRGELVFCQAAGVLLPDAAFVWALRRVSRRAGLRKTGWHMLRHTFASHLAMRGVPIRTISELLGHATIQMTMRYAHLSPNVARDAVNQLDVQADGPRTARDGLRSEK